MKFLYAAYAVTWVIHFAYIGWMSRGYRRIKEELQELKKP